LGNLANQIDQFGIGFYSVFLVSQKVQMASKRNNREQYVWQFDTKGNFSTSKDPREKPPGEDLMSSSSSRMLIKTISSVNMRLNVLSSAIWNSSPSPSSSKSRKRKKIEVSINVDLDVEADEQDPNKINDKETKTKTETITVKDSKVLIMIKQSGLGTKSILRTNLTNNFIRHSQGTE